MNNMKKKVVAAFVAGVIMASIVISTVVITNGDGGFFNPVSTSADSRDDNGD